MNRKGYIILLLLFLCATGSFAQRKRTKKNKTKAKTEVVDEKLQEKLRLMASATQDIVVIDSIVVGKNNFLSHYRLSADAGTIASYSDVFNTSSPSDSSFVYINEMGDKCYYSQGDTARRVLYTRDLVDNEWMKPTKIIGIDNNIYKKQNYPFMMPDGTTFYFASTGKESIGGYDIFITRYDSDGNRFLNPENIGMPYNSTANDYMYAVDEMNQIGWFASDRNQHKDSVCIYVFIPTETRTTYSNTKYTEAQIASLSRLHRIADTWRDGSERALALKRLANIVSTADVNKTEYGIRFIINDNIVYTSLSDFKSSGSQEKFFQLLELQQLLRKQRSSLDIAREKYSVANHQEKNKMKSEILSSEQNALNIENQIKDLEKEIRNSEIKNIK